MILVADVFEHPNGDNGIVGTGGLAIVVKTNVYGKPLARFPPELDLVPGNREAPPNLGDQTLATHKINDKVRI